MLRYLKETLTFPRFSRKSENRLNTSLVLCRLALFIFLGHLFYIMIYSVLFLLICADDTQQNPGPEKQIFVTIFHCIYPWNLNSIAANFTKLHKLHKTYNIQLDFQIIWFYDTYLDFFILRWKWETAFKFTIELELTILTIIKDGTRPYWECY